MWAAIVLIVLITVFAAVMMSRNSTSMSQVTDEYGNPIADTARELELAREIEELRERVRVLERIVVEEHEAIRLSAEIESLRADREPDQAEGRRDPT